jgi:NAD(P)-dependent dehydrogenase (short-subunit alcohol dehydrogenase family)
MAIARALVTAGANVMIGDILEEVGRQTAKDLGGSNVKTGFVKLDVTEGDQWETAAAAAVTQLGGFDIFVNNAGIEITSLVVDLKEDDIRKMCAVNIGDVALGTKHAFRAMRPGGAAGKGGAIVNVSSVSATIAFPAICVYSGAKSAVDRMTRVGALEAGKLGYGIRVNCVFPGLIATEMGINLAKDIVANGLAAGMNAAMQSVVDPTPLGRLAEVTEVATRSPSSARTTPAL